MVAVCGPGGVAVEGARFVGWRSATASPRWLAGAFEVGARTQRANSKSPVRLVCDEGGGVFEARCGPLSVARRLASSATSPCL